MFRAPAIATLAATVLLGGCASANYDVAVESVSVPPKSGKKPVSYWIVSRDSSTDVAGLRYQEAVTYVKTALSAKGLYEAPRADKADMVIEIDYGATPKRRLFDRPERAATPQRKNQQGEAGAAKPPPPGGAGSDRAPLSIDMAVYQKHLVIEAHTTGSKITNEPPEMLWRVSVTNVDESKDLRKYVPVMAAAAMDNIDQSTNGEKKVTVDSQGKPIGFIKKGM